MTCIKSMFVNAFISRLIFGESRDNSNELSSHAGLIFVETIACLVLWLT